MRKGIYSALVNAFDESGRPSREGMRAVVRYNIERMGVDGLYVNGSTGENMNMGFEDRMTTLRWAAEDANGECSLIAQIGSNVIEDVLALARAAADAGYDAVSAVTPIYYQFAPEEVVSWYRRIADESPLPLILYFIPKLSGTSIGRGELSLLLEHENIAGVKFTNTDFFALERMRSAFPEKLFFSGFDEMLLSAAVLGTDGAIGSTYNIIGPWAKKVFAAAQAGDLETARRYQGAINAAVDILLGAGLFPTLKAALAEAGVPVGECRAPMGRIEEKHRAAARALLGFRERFGAE